MKHKPSLWSFILQSERSDEEHFTDVDTTRLPSFEGTQSPDDKESHVTVPDGHVTRGVGYHVAHRNPLYSGAEHTCLWELSQVPYMAYILRTYVYIMFTQGFKQLKVNMFKFT